SRACAPHPEDVGAIRGQARRESSGSAREATASGGTGMGEKGLSAGIAGAAGASGGVVSEGSETGIGTATDTTDKLEAKLIDQGVDHAIEEGRDRIHRRPDPEPGSE